MGNKQKFSGKCSKRLRAQMITIAKKRIDKTIPNELHTLVNTVHIAKPFVPTIQEHLNCSYLRETLLSNSNVMLQTNVQDMDQKETDTFDHTVQGRRIVDFSYMFEQMKQISTHGPLDCGIQHMKITGEKRIGFYSKFTIECRMCNTKFHLRSEDVNSAININRSAVAGIMAIGCGYSQLQELSGSLDVPPISENLYSETHSIISNAWEATALDEMNKAARKERLAALEANRVDSNGVPIIDVVADGCWSKRSYKKNYSALSGAAAIIGKKFGEVLFLAVKNKYCCICARAENISVSPASHSCFKNYDGPSTGMESAILVEGFKTSIEMHGLVYGRIISDGDSSTYSKILASRPYFNHTVEKIQCRNHILRNFCNKMHSLTVDTKHPIIFRKNITKRKILTMRKTICLSINHHKKSENTNLNKQIQYLYDDIVVAPLHAFGRHHKCKEYFCSQSDSGSISANPDFFESTVFQGIQSTVSTISKHARSLIHDVDSNIVEQFHSIVAKFVGGKRVNYSLKQSYQARCAAAVVSHNSKTPLSSLYKTLLGYSPKTSIKKIERRRMKRNRRKYLRKKNRLFNFVKADSNYGDNCLQPDMDNDLFERAKSTFLDGLRKTDEDRKKILQETILQSDCSEWLELRRNMLTASIFGKVVKRRKDISCAALVKNLLYKANIDHVESINHGKRHEKLALDQLGRQQNVVISQCGLFIDEYLPFLGATPDGLSGEMIVEVKCPLSAYKIGLEEAIKKKKLPFWKIAANNRKQINKNSDWFMQVQGQLHISKKSKCLFGVWFSPDFPLEIEVIERDDVFWENTMRDKLVTFYMDCILPELVDPRHTRNMNIRDPPYILDAIKNRELKRSISLKSRTKSAVDISIPSDVLMISPYSSTNILHGETLSLEEIQGKDTNYSFQSPPSPTNTLYGETLSLEEVQGNDTNYSFQAPPSPTNTLYGETLSLEEVQGNDTNYSFQAPPSPTNTLYGETLSLEGSQGNDTNYSFQAPPSPTNTLYGETLSLEGSQGNDTNYSFQLPSTPSSSKMRCFENSGRKLNFSEY